MYCLAFGAYFESLLILYYFLLLASWCALVFFLFSSEQL